MRPTARVLALVLTATAVAAAPVVSTEAKAKKPRPPTTATIKRLLTNAYCQPTKNARGESVTSVKVTFKSIKRAKARVGSYLTDGTPANRKTYVFPIRADYFCDYKYTNGIGTTKAQDKHIKGDYSFFRDEFGKWTQRNHGHDVQNVPGND
jgi:hypothetical protein